MDDTESTTDAESPQSISTMLRLAVRTAQEGNLPAARALLRVLAREHPNYAAVWLCLAGFSETRAEQQQALEQAVQLEPSNRRARAALSRLRSGRGMVSQELAPVSFTADEQPRRTFMTSALIPWIALPILLIALGFGLWFFSSIAEAPVKGPNQAIAKDGTPTKAQPSATVVASATAQEQTAGNTVVAESTAAVTPSTILATNLPFETATTLPSATTVETTSPTAEEFAPGVPTPSVIVVASSPTAPTLTTLPSATATIARNDRLQALPYGSLIERDGWLVTLASPARARIVSDTLPLSPTGYLAVVVVIVGNRSNQARVLPSDLLWLDTGQGERNFPVPGWSSAYLSRYGQGDYGDLAFEQPIPPGGGLVAVPLLFDLSSTEVRFLTPDGRIGWRLFEPPNP